MEQMLILGSSVLRDFLLTSWCTLSDLPTLNIILPSPALPSDVKVQGVVLRDGKSDFLLLRDRVAVERRFSR